MIAFRFHWLDGKHEDGSGINVVDAFRRLGYGGGAIIDPPKVNRNDRPDINNN